MPPAEPQPVPMPSPPAVVLRPLQDIDEVLRAQGLTEHNWKFSSVGRGAVGNFRQIPTPTPRIYAKCMKHGSKCAAWWVLDQNASDLHRAQVELIEWLGAASDCTEDRHRQLASQLGVRNGRKPLANRS